MLILALSFENTLDDGFCRDLAVGSLWDDKATWAFDDVVSYDHVTTYWQTVHEMCIVGHCHLTLADGPAAPVLVRIELWVIFLKVLAIVSVLEAAPVLGIDEVSAFESLHLVILDGSAFGETWIKLIAMWLSDNYLIASSNGKLSE